LLIREAGGIVTRPDGSADVLSAGGNGSIVAGNAAMHRWLIDLLRKS
jgi:fructose-1,6-bisphosphatase/inositol monophosphatase family enzyme